MMHVTNTLVMPISGSKFPNQIAITKHLVGCGYMPDLIMGSSGGCIAGMLMITADIGSVKCSSTYQKYCSRLDDMLKELDKSWYMSPWSNNPILNTAIGLGNGSLYNKGNGESFMTKYKVDLDKQPEMWMGTRSFTEACSQVFCTRSKDDSLIALKGAKYMNSSISYAIKASMASCSVPGIVPMVDIHNNKYIDGGVSHASPLGPCMCAFDDNQISFHIVYICSIRYSSKEDPLTSEIEDDDIWNRFASSTAGMVTGLHIPDRNNGIRAVGPDAKKKHGIGRAGLIKALARQKRSHRSFIELCPLQAEQTNFVTMKKGDAKISVDASYESGFSVRHWYV